MPSPPFLGGLANTDAKVKGKVAGEVRIEPRNQTRVRFRSGVMVKMQELVENMP
jgi:hypothetical protein